jgi:Glutaredoxin-like domain (DUF836)
MESEQSQIANPKSQISIAFYTRADCPLCDRLEAMLRPHLRWMRNLAEVRFEKRDIFDDKAWREAFQCRIPVLTRGDDVLLEGRPEAADVTRAMGPLLREAGQPSGPPVYLPEAGKPCIVFRRMHRDVLSLESALGAGAYAALATASAEADEAVRQSDVRMRHEDGPPVAEMLASARATAGGTIVVRPLPSEPELAIGEALLERDPHAVVEGALLAARMAAARRVVFAPPPGSGRARLRHAVSELLESGLLGDAGIGDLRLDLTDAGQADAQPGHAIRALDPETACNLPWIVQRGGPAYAKYGHGSWRGTKIVWVEGPVQFPGLHEVEFGVTPRQLVFELAGGLAEGRALGGLRVGRGRATPPEGPLWDAPLVDALTGAGEPGLIRLIAAGRALEG